MPLGIVRLILKSITKRLLKLGRFLVDRLSALVHASSHIHSGCVRSWSIQRGWSTGPELERSCCSLRSLNSRGKVAAGAKGRKLLNESPLLLCLLANLELLLWSYPVTILGDVYFEGLLKILVDLSSAAAPVKWSLALAERVLEELLAMGLIEDLLQSAAVANDVRIPPSAVWAILDRHGCFAGRWAPGLRNISEPHVVCALHWVENFWNAKPSIVVVYEVIPAWSIREIVRVLGIKGAQHEHVMHGLARWHGHRHFILFLCHKGLSY